MVPAAPASAAEPNRLVCAGVGLDQPNGSVGAVLGLVDGVVQAGLQPVGIQPLPACGRSRMVWSSTPVWTVMSLSHSSCSLIS